LTVFGQRRGAVLLEGFARGDMTVEIV